MLPDVVSCVLLVVVVCCMMLDCSYCFRWCSFVFVFVLSFGVGCCVWWDVVVLCWLFVCLVYVCLL